MVTLTPAAIKKVKEVMEQQDPKPAALRIGIRGGGCSGFQYALEFDGAGVAGPNDSIENYDGLLVIVDNISAMYLEGCEVDYLETLEASGFKFNNPNVKSTCGCGSSFQA
jgi:iron-sulfur cluster assembly accessory protein